MPSSFASLGRGRRRIMRRRSNNRRSSGGLNITVHKRYDNSEGSFVY
jgi:hypothetical protein